MSEKFTPKDHALTEEILSEVKYTNLKNHSGYTLQMGFGTTKEHIKTCYKKGHQGCVFTDKGVMMGSLDLYNQSRDDKVLKGIGYEGKAFPIIMGASLFITEDTDVKNKLQKYYSVSLYAKNQAGYENLCYLTSIASQDAKFYVKPRIDFFDLFANTNGLVCLSGGFNGIIGQSIYENHGQFRGEFFKFVNSDAFSLVKDYLEKFAETNAPDKVSKLISVMEIEADKEDYWRAYLADENFWAMFPKLLNSPELWQLLKDTDGMFPIEKEYFQIANSIGWEEAEKGVFFNLMTDLKVEVLVAKFKEVFKDDFYFEFACTDLSRRWVKDLKQHEDIGENPQDRVQQRLVELAEEFDIKIVLVQDSHMPNADQHLLQSIMIWNSPSGKDGWHFYEALEIMDVPTMYEKVISLYPWVSDEQFLNWTNNSDEILNKSKNCKLAFEPSLPELDYENHYVNKLPVVIRRALMFELQERKLWSEVLKAKIIELQDLTDIAEIPQDIKDNYNTKDKIIDFEDIEARKEENIFLEAVLKQMKTYFKKEKDFVQLITKSEEDIQLRTGLKVMIRNKKLLPRIVDEVKLQKIIEERAPGKKSTDFKQEVIQNMITKYNLFTISDDPMLLLGGEAQRRRLAEELNTIQYNGIIKLMSYFMLLEDVSNFIAENGHLRGFGRGCLVGDTLVLTKNKGMTKLSNIQDGDFVFTHTGNAKEVIKTFRYEVDEKLLEIETTNSVGSIKLTKDHKVYGVKTTLTEQFLNSKNPGKQRKFNEITHEPSFFPAEELKVGDLLFVKKPDYQQYNSADIDLASQIKDEKVIISEDEIKWLNPLTNNISTTHKRYIVKDAEFFYILGKWVGDGHVSYNETSRKYVVAFAFNSKDEKEITRVYDYFSQYGFSVSKYKSKDKNLVSLEVYSKVLALWFKNSFPEYKNSSNTKYLGDFKYVQVDYLKELFKGLMSADGHIGPSTGKNRTESFDTTSPRLRDEVKEVCIYLGIPCSISTRLAHKRGEYECKESYKIRFAGLNLDAKLLKNKVYEDGYYVKVKNLREVEAEPVYDLMIADEPSYTTSNFTVHNSGAGSIVAYALDITDCDPLEYNLLFERFLTKERIGEVFYEVEGVSLKDFLSSQNQNTTIAVSAEDLKLDEDESMDSGDEEVTGEEV